MVHLKNNFIVDSENSFLVSILEEKSNKSLSYQDSFYEWYEISKQDEIFKSPIFQILKLSYMCPTSSGIS